MNVLALDLTSEYGSIAIRVDGRTVTEHLIESSSGFAHLVFGAIENVLAESGLKLAAIDCFAVSTGPGAFTALRVALAAAKGLAETTGKRAVGISKLRAMASFGTESRRAVILDARRDDVFAAVYNNQLELVLEETVTKFEPWLSGLRDTAHQFITSDAAWLETVLRQSSFRECPVIEAPKSLGSAIAQCAEDDIRRGIPGDPATLDANYVRRSDAELYWTDN